MKASTFLAAFGLSLAVVAAPTHARAQAAEQAPEQNFELALVPGVQLRGQDSAIRILRLGLYSKNVSVQGLDIGIVNHNTGGVSKGVQLGLVGVVEGDFSGWQGNQLVNTVQNEFKGFQSGILYNQMGTGEGFQFGIFNRAREMSGFQLGIVNWAENLKGIQIGLINIISGKESFQFLPIVNWSF